MKPAPLDYEAPTQIGDAVALLADTDRDAVVLAGGQSLMPMLNLRLAHPDLLVDLRRIEGLDGIRLEDERILIGAMATKRSVEQSTLVRDRQPLLHAATKLVGHPQIRNRGTVGGSMAHADPAAEYPAAAVICDMEMRVVGPQGERMIAAADFFDGYLSTALEPGEILVEVCVPVLSEGTGWSFNELSRRHGDFAMVGAAVTIGLDGSAGLDGSPRCSDARIVVFAVGSTPVRAHGAEDLINGEEPRAELFARAAAAMAEALEEPMSDVHASAEYRRNLAEVLVERGLSEAVARATVTP
jgi:carbon-monoxide dehydrogenase medium subunit